MPQTPAITAPSGVTQPVAHRASLTSTPVALRAWQVATVLVIALFAVFGTLGLGWRQQAIERTQDAASQLIEVQDIRVSVVQADAIASSAYLAGGQEDPAQRAEYQQAIGNAADLMVAVAARAPVADAARLAQANRLLGVYVGLIEQARANNRQGFPVGAAYQRQANSVVANDDADVADIVGTLRDVEASRRQAVNDSLAGAHRAGAWLALTGIVALVVLVVAGWWLATRFRRLFNAPLAAATILTLVLLVGAGFGQAVAVGDADDAVGGVLETADVAAQARAAGFDARAQEALSLINRGNGQANDARWALAADTAGTALDSCDDPCAGAAEAFADYAGQHAAMRSVDVDDGDWDEAVRQALDPAGELVVSFDRFAADSSDVVTANAAAADAGLADAASGLGWWQLIVAIGGLIAAALAAWGLTLRLKEYQ